MRFPMILTSCALLALAVSCTEGAEAGGFGKAEVKDPGVHNKPTSDKRPEAPDFANAMQMQPKVENGQLTVSVALKDGYHAYAPGEETGKPVGLVVKEANGWKTEGELEVPAGKTKDLGELGKSQVLEGAFELKQKVTGGTGEVEGELAIQICTDAACDRPRKHPFKAPAPAS
jgi:hypothetical protein